MNNKGKIEQTKEAKGIMLTSKKKTLCMRTKAVCTGTMVVCGNRLFHETGAEVEEREREKRERLLRHKAKTWESNAFQNRRRMRPESETQDRVNMNKTKRKEI